MQTNFNFNNGAVEVNVYTRLVDGNVHACGSAVMSRELFEYHTKRTSKTKVWEINEYNHRKSFANIVDVKYETMDIEDVASALKSIEERARSLFEDITLSASKLEAMKNIFK